MERFRTNTNKTGWKGVFANHNRFMAQIRKDGKIVTLGSFETPEEAARAYAKAYIEIRQVVMCAEHRQYPGRA